MQRREQDFEKLEQALVSAGRGIRYPATPPIAERIWARELSPRRAALLPRWVMPVLIAVLAAITLLLVIPDTRDALAQFLGLRTIRIIPASPTAPGPVTPGTASTTPAPTSTSARETQCCETTLSDAQTKSRFKILLPPGELPSKVYVQELPQFAGGAQQVILVFGDPSAPRLTLYQATNVLYGKVVGTGTVVEETTINGERALWLTGAVHILVFLDSNGRTEFSPERAVSANTLSWESGNVTYRIESDLGKQDITQFAESLR